MYVCTYVLYSVTGGRAKCAESAVINLTTDLLMWVGGWVSVEYKARTNEHTLAHTQTPAQAFNPTCLTAVLSVLD